MAKPSPLEKGLLLIELKSQAMRKIKTTKRKF